MESVAQQAAVFFGLALVNYGGSVTDPEKFQLYSGLKNLAEAVASMDARLKQIERHLQQMATLRSQGR